MNSQTTSVTIPIDGSRTQTGKSNAHATVKSAPHVIILLESSASGAAARGEEDSSLPIFDTSPPSIEKTSSPAITATNNIPESTHQKAKWDPFRRYWSDAHSFPDYGSPQLGEGIMIGRIKNLGKTFSFAPLDRLNGSRAADSTPLQDGTPKRSQESQISLPQPKRAKATHHTSPARSIGGDSDVVEVTSKDMPSPARDFRGSMSTQSNGERIDDRDIPEYRQTEAHAGFNRPRKRRYREPKAQGGSHEPPPTESRTSRVGLLKTRKNEIMSDPIEDAVDLVQKPPSRHARREATPKAAQSYTNSTFALNSSDEDDEIAEAPPKSLSGSSAGHRNTSQRQVRSQGKHSANSSDDELQAVDQQPPSKRHKGAAFSSSLSTRGNIARTQYSPQAPPDGFGDGLVVKRALSQPKFLYPSSAGAKEPTYSTYCLLNNDKSSPASLKAIDPRGDDVAGLEWLRLSLKTATTIWYSPGSPIIKMSRATTIRPEATTGALLMIEFGDAKDATTFVKWSRANGPQHLHHSEIQGSKLQTTFEKQTMEISNHISKQPDGDIHMSADDLKLLERKKITKQEPVPTAESRRTLRSRMQAPESGASYLRPVTSDLFYETPSRLRPSTRSSQRLPKEPSPKPELWTEQHPNWAAEWKVPLIYQRTTVDREDIIRLDEGQFMNDSLISFYLKYLHHQLELKDKRAADKIYIFNSFFYEKLKPKGRNINYDGVKNWTAKVDLFSFDYIIVPVNESSHWWVTVICNPGELLPSRQAVKVTDPDLIALDARETGHPETGNIEVSRKSPSSVSPLTHEISHVTIDSSDDKDNATNDEDIMVTEQSKKHTDPREPMADTSTPRPSSSKSSKSGKKRAPPPPRKYNPRDPRIITLDSLGSSHSAVVRSLKEYLVAEAEEKKGEKMENPGPLGTTVKDIPMQDNFTDCGVYLLGYIREFMKDPDKFVSDILQKEDRAWQLNSSELRNDLRELILSLQKEYQSQEQERRRARAQQKRSKERSKEQSEPRSSEKLKEKTPTPQTPNNPSPTPAPNTAFKAVSRHDSPEEPGEPSGRLSKEATHDFSTSLAEQPSGLNVHVKPAEDCPRSEGDKGHLPNNVPTCVLDDSDDVVRESIESPEELPCQVASPPHAMSTFAVIRESSENNFLQPLPSSSTPPSTTKKPRSKAQLSPRRLLTDRKTGTSSPYFPTSQFGANGKVTKSRLIPDDDKGHKKETIDLTT